jgi:AcrR family transcriptional regulator
MKTRVEESRRSYRQGIRAEAAVENTRRIVAAAQDLFLERLYDQVSLADVAARAGVGVQTLIRRFPTKEDLVRGVGAEVRGRVVAQRSEAPVGDVEGAVANLVEHYETTADMALLLLMQEERVPAFREMADEGRRVHREWTERVFAPQLEGLARRDRRLRLAQLVAICDVYTWKLLRRDQGLNRARTERAIAEMVNGLVGGSR